MQQVRVRFAPSPTGPLHIGGVRTALYNYLFAKKHGGTFILRIEDTDQGRYVEGAEQYIKDALQWFGLNIDEGPDKDGLHGPYRQSERKKLYSEHINILLKSGVAYMAFDTTEELEAMKEKFKAEGNHSPKYDASVRMTMRNSLTLSEDEVNQLLKDNTAFTVRLKVIPGQTVQFEDEVRGSVSFQSVELDDKILLKSDGMPTYHFANVVDDRDMNITHVIRGEEWLSSTAHHVLLYRAFGWENEMPKFTHLPLILKPTGKGKLSKRDGAKFGFPVFPLNWNASDEEVYEGFKENGFLPDAVINFLAFLGWNPGTEQEIFNLDELIQVFSLDKIVKSGARFDYQKALWYNQQYILKSDMNDIYSIVEPMVRNQFGATDEIYLKAVIQLMRERIHTLNEFVDSAAFFFADVTEYDEKMIRKKWKPDSANHLNNIISSLRNSSSFEVSSVEEIVKAYINDNELSFGAVFPFLRIGLSGSTKGPDMFEMMSLLGKDTVCERLENAIPKFEAIKND